MPVGKWMEIIGMDSKAPGGRREGVIPPPVTRPASQRTAQLREQSAREHQSKDDDALSPSPPPEKEKQERKVAKKEEKEHGWEPWLEIQRGNFNPVKVDRLSLRAWSCLVQDMCIALIDVELEIFWRTSRTH